MGATMPAWSPDGRWSHGSISNLQSGGIRISRGDATVVRSFKPSFDVLIFPTWSRDSKQLAFFDVSRLGAILKIADVQTGATKEVLRLQHPQMRVFGLAWMADGRQLLITPDPQHIVAVDIVTGKRREIYATAPENSVGYSTSRTTDTRWRSTKGTTTRCPFTSCTSILTVSG